MLVVQFGDTRQGADVFCVLRGSFEQSPDLVAVLFGRSAQFSQAASHFVPIAG